MRRVGYRRRREMIGTRPNEDALVTAILQTLVMTVQDCFAWRMETNGSVRGNGDGTFRLVKNKYGRGKADVAGVVNGKGFVIEAKRPGNYLERHQQLWLSDYVSRGKGRAAVCYSADDALEFVGIVANGGPDRWRGEITA